MANIRREPEDASLLTQYKSHRTQKLSANGSEQLRVQRTCKFLYDKLEHPDVLLCLRRARFYGCYKAGAQQLNLGLLSSLVERWRSETHTFHLVVGETTVTLQDVAVYLGLPVHGTPLPPLSTKVHDTDYWNALIWERLRIRLPSHRIDATNGKMYCTDLNAAWTNGFREDGYDDPILVEQRARLWIFGILACHLFSDASGKWANLHWLHILGGNIESIADYNWGAAVLAYLYHQLDMCVSVPRVYLQGAVTLLQWWVWDHVVPVRPQVLIPGKSILIRTHPLELERDDLPPPPRGSIYLGQKTYHNQVKGGMLVYRDMFDKLLPQKFVWRPYADTLEGLPDYCLDGREWWTTRVPLIYGCIVEWHRPERVMRQFGFGQAIPDLPLPPVTEEHAKGKEFVTGDDLQRLYVFWEDADVDEVAIDGVPEEVMDPQLSIDYMKWYRQHSILYIGDSSCDNEPSGCISTSQTDMLPWRGLQQSYHSLKRLMSREPDSHINSELDLVCKNIQSYMRLGHQEHLLQTPDYVSSDVKPCRPLQWSSHIPQSYTTSSGLQRFGPTRLSAGAYGGHHGTSSSHNGSSGSDLNVTLAQSNMEEMPQHTGVNPTPPLAPTQLTEDVPTQRVVRQRRKPPPRRGTH